MKTSHSPAHLSYFPHNKYEQSSPSSVTIWRGLTCVYLVNPGVFAVLVNTFSVLVVYLINVARLSEICTVHF